MILLRAVEPGQTVAASFQTPVLFQIAEDLAQMQIDLSIDEADVGQIKEGLPVSFTVDAFPDRQFSGEVKQVRLSATSNANVDQLPGGGAGGQRRPEPAAGHDRQRRDRGQPPRRRAARAQRRAALHPARRRGRGRPPAAVAAAA